VKGNTDVDLFLFLSLFHSAVLLLLALESAIESVDAGHRHVA
jgi:hypothetical protein